MYSFLRIANFLLTFFIFSTTARDIRVSVIDDAPYLIYAQCCANPIVQCQGILVNEHRVAILWECAKKFPCKAYDIEVFTYTKSLSAVIDFEFEPARKYNELSTLTLVKNVTKKPPAKLKERPIRPKEYYASRNSSASLINCYYVSLDDNGDYQVNKFDRQDGYVSLK